METAPLSAGKLTQDELYQQAASDYGAALARLARGYEADPDRRQDLIQEILLAVWQSLTSFDGRCSLRTWVYRVAHNVAASYVSREHRRNTHILIGLDLLETLPAANHGERVLDERNAFDKLLRLIQQLKPLDRQVILSYLEGMDATSISEITGISPGNVATKIHRIKVILARQFQGGSYGQ